MSLLKDISQLKHLQDKVCILGKIDELLSNNLQNE